MADNQRRFRLSILHLLVLTTVCATICAWWTGDLPTSKYRWTRRPLDVAILGRGYFQIIDPHSAETRYTRYGRFSLERYNRIAFGRGLGAHLVEPTIGIPPDRTRIEIKRNGTVIAKRNNGERDRLSNGMFQLARFSNRDGLLEVSPGVFAETKASGSVFIGTAGTNGFGDIAQGWIENTFNESSSWNVSRVLITVTLGLLLWAVIEQRRQRRLYNDLMAMLKDK